MNSPPLAVAPSRTARSHAPDSRILAYSGPPALLLHLAFHSSSRDVDPRDAPRADLLRSHLVLQADLLRQMPIFCLQNHRQTRSTHHPPSRSLIGVALLIHTYCGIPSSSCFDLNQDLGYTGSRALVYNLRYVLACKR